MANGDIVSVSINPTAWQAIITVSGFGPSGEYNMGFGPKYDINSPYQPKITFNLKSSGFNDVGDPITLDRTIYGTTGIRLPYPNQTQKDETVNGGNIDLKIALSDYIYQKDSDITVNILSGFYTSGSLINSGTVGLTVINNSSLQYPKVIANWSWPNYDVITGSTFKLRCCAFHRSAQSGRPVRVVKFTAQDTGNNIVTGFVTTASIDSTIPDKGKVVEYIAELSSANLIQGSSITGNFIAYPWYGDSGSLIDTNDGVNIQPTPLYAPLTLLNDKNQTYGVTIAVVNSLTGNNNLGMVLDSGSFNLNNPPAAYATIGSAATGIRNYNNTNRNRNDVGRGIIYLQSGTHALIGQTISQSLFGNDPKTYLTIAGFPGEDRFNIQITGGGGTSNIQEHMKFQNIHITGTTSNIFNGTDYVWFDNCSIFLSNTSAINVSPVMFFTFNDIRHVRNGLKAFTPGTNMNPSLVRGNLFDDFDRGITVYTVIGNLKTGKQAGIGDFFTDASGLAGGIKNPTNSILAFNKLLHFSGGSANCITYSSLPNSHGLAIVQNLIERIVETGVTLGGVATIGATSENIQPFENFLIWHNTMIGERQQMFYNDNGSLPYFRGINNSILNNITENYAVKTDIFGTQNGNRTGNWSQVYGVGYAGNGMSKVNPSVNGQFPQDFWGLNSTTGTNVSTGYYEFVAPGSINEKGGTGNGNYYLKEISPLVNLPINFVLPYDIEGNPRTASASGNSAGAFAYQPIVISGVTYYAFLRIDGTSFYSRNGQLGKFISV